MRSGTARQPRLERGLEYALAGVIGAVVLAMAALSLRLRVDYFDSYQSLLNARALLSRNPADYSIYRGIFYPVLLLPATAVGRVTHSQDVTFALAHLSAVGLFVLLLIGTFLLLRAQIDRGAALVGTCLLSINLLIINSAPVAKEDIAGAALIIVALYIYWRGRQSGRLTAFVAAGLLAGIAAGTRYQLLPVWLVFVAVFEIVAAVRDGPRRGWVSRGGIVTRLFLLGATPVILLFVFPTVLYPLLGRSSFLHAPSQFISDLRLVGEAVRVNEGTRQNYRFIVESVTWPLLLAAAAGAVLGFRRRPTATLFHGLWIILVFGLQTYGIGHKEARFLFPCFPSIYFLVAEGLRAIPELGALAGGRWRRPAITLGLTGLLVALPVTQAIGALARFTDPVYTTDYEASVSRYAAGLASRGVVRWLGPAYPLHPRSYLFDRADIYTYIYHDYSHVVTYWTRDPTYPSASVTFVVRGAVAYPDQGMLSLLADGDALIVNREPSAYAAPNAPPRLKPLIVERAAVQTLSADPSAPGTFSAGAATVVATTEPSGVVLRGSGLPDGDYELAASTPEAPGLATADAITRARDGRFELTVPMQFWAARSPGEALRLVALEAARSFTPPGQ